MSAIRDWQEVRPLPDSFRLYLKTDCHCYDSHLEFPTL